MDEFEVEEWLDSCDPPVDGCGTVLDVGVTQVSKHTTHILTY